MLGGVCAGIAQRLDADAIVVRIFVVLLTCVTAGLAAIAYAIMWARMPLEPEGPVLFDIMPERAESSAYGLISGDGKAASCQAANAGDRAPGTMPVLVRLALAVALVVLFLIVSTNICPYVPGTRWWQFWPVGFMIAGVCLIVFPVNSEFEVMWHALGIVVTSVFAMVLPATLGITTWASLLYAVTVLWPLPALALVVFIAGAVTRDGRMVVVSAFIVVAFCLIALFAFALPNDPVAMMRLAYGEMAMTHL